MACRARRRARTKFSCSEKARIFFCVFFRNHKNRNQEGDDSFGGETTLHNINKSPGACSTISAEDAKVERMDLSAADSPAGPKSAGNVTNGNSTPATAKTSVSGDSPNTEGENMDTSNKKTSTGTPKGTPKANGSAKKPKSASKSPRAPRGTSKTYLELVHEAIVALKDRTGSSTPAIVKILISKYPNLEQKDNPNNRFKKNVMTALKTGVKAGRFKQIKASYKINSDFTKKEREKQRSKARAELKKKKDREQAKKKDSDAQKQKEEAEKKKDPIQAKIDMLRAKDPDSAELKKLLADRRKKAEAEARKKYIADRLRKRRYPIEDTRLHTEDKEWGVKAPSDVGPRPQLPYLFSLTETEERRSNRGYAAAASKCENIEKESHGLVSDMLQVYHFFRGDVHYVGAGDDTTGREIVPAFKLTHLIYAVDDILNGTAKRARMVPPLIVHLFVTCLQMLIAPPEEGYDDIDSRPRGRLQQEFGTHLSGALSPTSWADVCMMYMDAVHRHYTTAASVGKNVLQGLPIDVDYLLEMTDEERQMPFSELPDGYMGYFGGRECALRRAQGKLDRMDPWLLTAEELMALLRALTDDVLSRKPEISEDLSNREEQMYELLKAKRAADSKLRKVRLAYEGPKKPSRPKPAAPTDNANGKTDDKEAKPDDTDKTNEDAPTEDANGKSTEGESSENKVEAFKPTATKKQFLAAEKAQQKASEAYEKGTRSLMARTEPVGWDRNHNAVYCFRHDPEVLYVEMVKPSTTSNLNLPTEMLPKKVSWHVITQKSVFDQFTQSLDFRGKREQALQEELVGPPGLRRFLHDDIKERANAAAKIKEQEDLMRKLQNAKLKCDEEEGRRSGRLAGKAEEELGKIQEQIDQLNRQKESGNVVEELDYGELTGLDLLRSYDAEGKVETRRTREKKVAATVNTFQSMKCSKLFSTGNIDGTGFMGMLVSKMLEIEESCEELVPWDRTDMSRETWIRDLENLVFAWNTASPTLVGPSDEQSQVAASPKQSSADVLSTPITDVLNGSKKRPSTGGGSDSKRIKADFESGPSSLTPSQAAHKLRRPLLDLEKRIYDITGLATAAKDAADADDNMSAADEEENDPEKESKEKRAWKKIISKMNDIQAKSHSVIRELVVKAIAAARKAQLKGVVGQLRSALLEFHPNAAGACKAASLKILDDHGGYDYEDDDEDEDEDANEDVAEAEEPVVPSSLCAEAVIINSSLDGIEDAGHADWVDAVRNGKTLSRMACLVTAFVKRAEQKLAKVQEEKEDLLQALSVWEREEDRHTKNLAKAAENGKPAPVRKPSNVVVSEVWANVTFTDEIVMAKAEMYPWWPAKKCVPRDPDMVEKLDSINRRLVSLVGEGGGLRVVEASAIRPFTGKLVEEEEGNTESLANVAKETKNQLDDCMAMSRRILRAHAGKKAKKR